MVRDVGMDLGDLRLDCWAQKQPQHCPHRLGPGNWKTWIERTFQEACIGSNASPDDPHASFDVVVPSGS